VLVRSHAKRAVEGSYSRAPRKLLDRMGVVVHQGLVPRPAGGRVVRGGDAAPVMGAPVATVLGVAQATDTVGESLLGAKDIRAHG